VTDNVFLYLVGGPMRTGKTLCARRFNLRTGISYISTDDLVYMLQEAAPLLGIGHDLPGTTWRGNRDALAQYVEALADIRMRETRPLLLEGELHPASVANLSARYADQVRACFFGTPSLDVPAKLRALRAWSASGGDWLTNETAEVSEWAAKECITASVEYREAAAELRIPFFDLSTDFDAMLDRVVDYLCVGAT